MEIYGFLAEYMDFVEKIQGRKLVLFGAGANSARLIWQFFLHDEVTAIWDNDPLKQGKNFYGGVVTPPPDRTPDDADDLVVVITIADELAISDIGHQLALIGIRHVYTQSIFTLMNDIERYNADFSRKFHERNAFPLIRDNAEKIRRVRDLLADEKSRRVYDAIVTKTQYNLLDYTDVCDDVYEHYFSDGIFEYTDGEVLVDGGAYRGEDTIRFSRIVGDKFLRSHCFEPDAANYEKCIGNLAKRLGADSPSVSPDCYRSEKFVVYKSGLFSENKNMGFVSYGTHGSVFSYLRHLSEAAQVPAVRLDDVIDGGEKVTLIKFDLEGAEMAAMRGAEGIIKKDRPKLAICIYHNIEDLWEIPLYIHDLKPEYKLFVRHHTNRFWDSVLYARI